MSIRLDCSGLSHGASISQTHHETTDQAIKTFTRIKISGDKESDLSFEFDNPISPFHESFRRLHVNEHDVVDGKVRKRRWNTKITRNFNDVSVEEVQLDPKQQIECVEDWDCLTTSACFKGVCKDRQCSKDLDCNEGQVCFNMKQCFNGIRLAQSNCTSDYDCEDKRNVKCDSVNGTCMELQGFDDLESQALDVRSKETTYSIII